MSWEISFLSKSVCNRTHRISCCNSFMPAHLVTPYAYSFSSCRTSPFLCSLLLTAVRFQQLQNPLLNPGRSVAFGEEFPQIVQPEADLLLLVGLFCFGKDSLKRHRKTRNRAVASPFSTARLGENLLRFRVSFTILFCCLPRTPGSAGR